MSLGCVFIFVAIRRNFSRDFFKMVYKYKYKTNLTYSAISTTHIITLLFLLSLCFSQFSQMVYNLTNSLQYLLFWKHFHTSSDIIRHYKTTSDIIRHLQTSLDTISTVYAILKYPKITLDILRHLQTYANILRHTLTSSHTRHPLISSDIL